MQRFRRNDSVIPPRTSHSTGLELGQRGVAQQQSLGADVAAEVDLGLGALCNPAYGDHPAEAEGVVVDAVPRRECRDRTQPRSGDTAAADGAVGGELRRAGVELALPLDEVRGDVVEEP